MGEQEKPYLPHAVTVNEYLKRLEPEVLQKTQQKQVYELIRRETGNRMTDAWNTIIKKGQRKKP